MKKEHSNWNRAVKENTRFSKNIDRKKMDDLLNPSDVFFERGGFGKGLAKAFGEKKPVVQFISSKGTLSRLDFESTKFSSVFDKAESINFFTHFTTEPSSSEVADGIVHAHDIGATMLVAVGGGSSIDFAKAVNVGLNDPVIQDVLSGLPKEMETFKIPPALKDKIVARIGEYLQGKVPAEETEMRLPLVAVPTTSGTGSEVTPVSVITNSLNGEKRFIFGDLKPSQVVLDPVLTHSVPRDVTRDTGMDAFVQAIESYIHTEAATPETRELALNSIRLIQHNLGKAMDGDEGAREKMLLASTFAGLAFAISGLGPVHDLGEATASVKKMPHGESCSRFLTPVLDYYVEKGEKENAKNSERSSRIAEIGKEMTGKPLTPSESVESIRGFLKSLGAKTSAFGLGLDKGLSAEIIQRAGIPGANKEGHPNLLDVPDMDSTDYANMLKRALKK